MRLLTVTLLSLVPSTLAHFTLKYPTQRTADEEQQNTYPCSGANTPSANRTAWPVGGGPVNLKLGHDRSLVAVFLGLGNNPSAFNITLLPTIQEQGPGDFCLQNLRVPNGVAREGQSATIQVITDGNGGKGLYNCADITFVATGNSSFAAPSCTNGTGVSVVPYSAGAFPNTTVANSSSSASASAATATKTGAASKATGAAYVVGGALAVGFAALL
ncbi:MAG: hypothetical protein M1814_000347 [Vezdaea aestivalis]|nr:MAG: hypothetical protein M1814_000347 [Vezdaea aestivalis]